MMRHPAPCSKHPSGRWGLALTLLCLPMITLRHFWDEFSDYSDVVNLRWNTMSTSQKESPVSPTPIRSSHDHDENDSDWWLEPSGSKKIRRWGCDRTETPLIYVHLGKSGGGSVRARMASSSLNYTKQERWWEEDGSYYPIYTTNEGERQAFFCNGAHRNYRPNGTKTFEGTMPCHAGTPIGQAIACPGEASRTSCLSACEPNSETCRQVYVGHNYMGSEMHWLPPKYLAKWWAEFWETGEDDPITPHWNTLGDKSKTWCHPFANVTLSRYLPQKKEMFLSCSVPLGERIDAMATQSISKRPVWDHSSQSSPAESISSASWGPAYASLPVLRVTLVREPFSWLVSKFFWHEGNKQDFKCDDIEMAVKPEWSPEIRRPGQLVHWTDLHSLRGIEYSGTGWVERFAMEYIFYLCGEDCEARLFQQSTDLDELELQAEDNLRQSFAVVGLLNETNSFYDMVTKRVQYMNTSLNPEVVGNTHPSGGADSNRCKAVFGDPTFQEKLLEVSPTLTALVRLFKVAEEVNRFQLRELEECSIA